MGRAYPEGENAASMHAKGIAWSAANDEWLIHCDGFGCTESHPLIHAALGEEFFGTGRWCGWMYLDLNRPDIFGRELRFCSAFCAMHWMDRERINSGRMHPPTPLDDALRRPLDAVARKRAGLLTPLHAVAADGSE